MQLKLTMRPVRDEDEPFLRKLRGQIDRERLQLDYFPPEDEELVEKIVTYQYSAHAHDRKNLNWDHKHCIIELESEPVGRFIVTQNSEEIRLADIEVLASHRGMSIGQQVIASTQRESHESRRPIRVHVPKLAAEMGSYYLSIGFRVLEERTHHIFMEWLPPSMQGRTIHFDTGKK